MLSSSIHLHLDNFLIKWIILSHLRFFCNCIILLGKTPIANESFPICSVAYVPRTSNFATSQVTFPRAAYLLNGTYKPLKIFKKSSYYDARHCSYTCGLVMWRTETIAHCLQGYERYMNIILLVIWKDIVFFQLCNVWICFMNYGYNVVCGNNLFLMKINK